MAKSSSSVGGIAVVYQPCVNRAISGDTSSFLTVSSLTDTEDVLMQPAMAPSAKNRGRADLMNFMCFSCGFSKKCVTLNSFASLCILRISARHSQSGRVVQSLMVLFILSAVKRTSWRDPLNMGTTPG